ncbi:DUF1501 domain-containing protein [Roseomonas sp. CECT 9278]|uniref:DUF1501 domain-containing protein n=1 Tax=Roseomonas sp. CECT 9278 TaxID=2845823 RepID=UPI001E3AB658|nr:DUF1501 domain-containing protein [Roseomonas sp. CECT 9278]CAH0279227.1 hypothetical protein ROS9278_03892 [Roseomonas sp. CECT 9278]
MMARLGRRALLRAGLATAALPGLRGMAFADPAGAPPLLVLVFLRGGMDSLHFLSPADDAGFVEMRAAELRTRADGAGAGHRLDAVGGIDFRLHAEAGGLAEIWRDRRLALWPAAGVPEATRSHFEAQALMAGGRGSRQDPRTAQGWLAAWTAALAGNAPGPAAIAGQGGLTPELTGLARALAVPSLSGGLALPGGRLGAAALEALHAGGQDIVSRAVRGAIDDMRALDALLPRDGEGRIAAYRPSNGAAYGPAGAFGAALATVAQAAKLHPGLVAAQVDLGGWDTHDGQSWRMTNLVRMLSRGLAALDADLADLPRRWTVLVASEFGRRLRANANGGTDHGRAGTVMAFGRGGSLGGHFGAWPGLSRDALEDGVDLRVAEDYRAVFRTVMRDLSVRAPA